MNENDKQVIFGEKKERRCVPATTSKRVQQQKARTKGISYKNDNTSSDQCPQERVEYEKSATKKNKQSKLWVASGDQQQESCTYDISYKNDNTSSVQCPQEQVEYEKRATKKNKQSKLWVASGDQQQESCTNDISYKNDNTSSVQCPQERVEYEKSATKKNKQSKLWVASGDQQQCTNDISYKNDNTSSVQCLQERVEYEDSATKNEQSQLWVASGVQHENAWVDCTSNCDTSVQCEKGKVEYACEAASVTDINSYTMNLTQKVVHCEPCHIGQTVIQAHGFCTNCAEHLCESCCRSHKNHKAFKDHVLQNKNEMPTDDEKITIEDHCLKHDGKPIEYYCRSCDELACTVCMFKQHRSCQNVDYIPDIAETLEDTDEYKELTKDMNNLATKCTTGRKSLEASLRKSEESKDKALSKIKTKTADIKKVFDRLETEMNDKVQARYRTEQRKLNGLMEKQEAMTGQLEIAKKRIEYSKKARQMIKLFISVKKERKTVDNLENELQRLKQGNVIQSYTFEVSPSVEDIKVLLELGELNKEDKASDRETLMVSGATCNVNQSAFQKTKSDYNFFYQQNY